MYMKLSVLVGNVIVLIGLGTIEVNGVKLLGLEILLMDVSI